MRKEQSLPFLILAFIAVSITLGSCERAQDCTPLTRDYLVLQLIDTAGNATNDTLTVTSFSSTLILLDTISSTFQLPLDSFHDTITYKFDKPGYSNWIKVSYISLVSILSEDCGPEFIYEQLEILGTSYDSILVIDHTFHRSVEINIKVYND